MTLRRRPKSVTAAYPPPLSIPRSHDPPIPHLVGPAVRAKCSSRLQGDHKPTCSLESAHSLITRNVISVRTRRPWWRCCAPVVMSVAMANRRPGTHRGKTVFPNEPTGEKLRNDPRGNVNHCRHCTYVTPCPTSDSPAPSVRQRTNPIPGPPAWSRKVVRKLQRERLCGAPPKWWQTAARAAWFPMYLGPRSPRERLAPPLGRPRR